ncbi:hypothetical protein CQW23_28938 [Capsicum baccatum]|uniref:Protein NRT1/ PTR FAMILY 1.2 n=1 Tax=Capsicum baccatum TaxID=33114 RepID=A0A2G2VHX5_CAPBA|nr:hypothetical protein CQW23_28938 [Capsicum baccatum]
MALMNAALSALTPNMILYLMNEYHMDMTTGSNIMFIWSAATDFAPVVAAFMADAYVGRFQMIGLGSVVTLLVHPRFGLPVHASVPVGPGREGSVRVGKSPTLVGEWTVIPQARPPPCVSSNNICRSSDMLQFFFLCFSLGITAIGDGAIKSSSLAFGPDQLTREVYHGNARAMERYFSWYYALYALSLLVALTCLVYIQVNMGWDLGFGAPVLLMLFSTVLIYLGTPFYVKLKPKSSLITGLFQVIVASYRNRCLRLSSQSADILYHQKRGSAIVLPIVFSINLSQNSFPVLQATTMDRHIGSSFEIPAGSFGLFGVISAILWLVLYDCLILPIASKLSGKPTHFSTKERMGFGLFLSFLSVLVVAAVEGVRRSVAIKEGYSDDPQGVIPMSAIWLLPQNCLTGVAVAVHAIGQNEFYISEFPRSMSSVASAVLGVSSGVGSLLASFVMSTIHNLTKRGGAESWVSSNVNKGHYDYYYLVLAGFSLVNILCYVVCCRAYGPCKGEVKEEEKS